MYEVTLMIKNKSELLDSIKAKLGDDTSDEALALIEDINDTLDDYESKTSDSTNWKQKYVDNDAQWRQKYKDRFFNGDSTGDDDMGGIDDEPPKKPLSFEDLFTVKE